MNLRSTASRARRTAALALGAALLPLALSAAPVAAANHIHIIAGIGNCGFTGNNANPKATVRIEWRDSEGRLKSKQAVKSNGSGVFVSLCEHDELIEPGDTIKTTSPIGSKIVTVPLLSLSVDRATDVVSGLAPDVAELVIEVDTYNRGFGRPTLHTINTQADRSATWSADFGAHNVDIQGWDDVFVSFENTGSGGDMYYRHIQAQAVDVSIGLPWTHVAGNPGDQVDVNLANGADPRGNFSGDLDFYGSLADQFVGDDAQLVRPHVGDTVSSTAYPDISFAIPNVTASVNAKSDKLTGSCGTAAQTGYLVVVHHRDYTKVAERTGTTTGSGAFTAKFKTGTPTWKFRSGDEVTIVCKLSEGDTVDRTYTLP